MEENSKFDKVLEASNSLLQTLIDEGVPTLIVSMVEQDPSSKEGNYILMCNNNLDNENPDPVFSAIRVLINNPHLIPVINGDVDNIKLENYLPNKGEMH